jgi:hypothetical protein
MLLASARAAGVSVEAIGYKRLPSTMQQAQAQALAGEELALKQNPELKYAQVSRRRVQRKFPY